MNKLIPLAIVLGCAMLGGAIVYHAHFHRYQIAAMGNGMMVRLDTRTGTTTVCLPRRSDETLRTYAVPCDGSIGD